MRSALRAAPLRSSFFDFKQKRMAALLLITLVILWWIAVWGFFDMAILHMNRFEKMIVYGLMLLSIILLLQVNPELLDYF